MGGAIDINQPHVRGHTCQGGYCEPEFNSIREIKKLNKNIFLLPHVEGGHYEEVDCLFHRCGLMPHPLLSIFLCEYGLKVKIIV